MSVKISGNMNDDNAHFNLLQMSQEQNIQDAEAVMAARLRTIFTDKGVQQKFVESVVHNKPVGWSRKSQATYYKERYALELKKVLDDMMVSNKEFVFGYAWFEKTFGLGKDSLYLRVYQSMRYLLEKLDPDGKYKTFWETKIEMHRERGKGVTLRFRHEYQTGGPEFVPTEVMPQVEEPKWKQRMKAWLESDDETPFSQNNIILSPEEITELEIQLSALGDSILSSITAHSVKLIKRSS